MFFKTILPDQIAAAKETLYEAIPITGTLVSGTYGTWPNDTNVLKFTASHGLFESVYDYPYASSSANHIMDITFGVRSGSVTSDPVTQASQKYRIYKEMAQTLLGFDVTGNVRNFSLDDSTPLQSALFLNFSRLLTKDGINITTVTGTFGTGSFSSPFTGTVDFRDASGVTSTTAKVDSPAGQYWYLYTGSAYAVSDRIGMVFYQAGVLVLNPSASIFRSAPVQVSSSIGAGTLGYNAYVSTGSITEIADSWRRQIQNIQFQNTVQINSTIYNCQIGLNEFNYSSNPTYTSGSQILTKNSDATSQNITYITTVGLYSTDGQLTAVAKLSEPIKKTQADAINIRVRLDY